MALEGNLQDMSLVDLFRIFRMGQKTGRLMLTTTNERGIVYAASGRLIDAVVVNRVNRQVLAVGEAAVMHVLQWDNGSFTFQYDPTLLQRQARITRDNTWLMLEGLRRRTKPLLLPSHQRIALDTPLKLTTLLDNADRNVRLELNQWQMIDQIGASRNLRTLCKRTGMAPETAVRIASELVAIGLMDIVANELSVAGAKQHSHLASKQVAAGSTRVKPLPTERSLFNAVMRRVREL